MIKSNNRTIIITLFVVRLIRIVKLYKAAQEAES